MPRQFPSHVVLALAVIFAGFPALAQSGGAGGSGASGSYTSYALPTAAPADAGDGDGAAASDEVTIPIRSQVIPTGDGIRTGDWLIRPFAALRVESDDNIFLTSSNETSDTIFVTTAGAALSRKGSGLGVELAAAGTSEVFSSETDQNNGSGHFRGGVEMTFGRSFVRVWDSFTTQKSPVQLSAGSPAVIAAGGDRISSTTNLLGLSGGYRWSKLGLEGGYENSLWDYEKALENLDATQHKGSLVSSWAFSPKVEARLELEARSVTFTEDVNNDYTLVGIFVGAAWKATEKVRVSGRVGSLSQTADDGGLVADKDEYSGAAGDVSVAWTATEKVTVSLRAARDVYPTAGANFQVVNLGTAEARWAISPPWHAAFRASYQQSAPSVGADSSTTGAGFTLGYQIKDWLAAALLYDVQSRTSDNAAADYDNSRAGLQVSVGF